ncbi:glycoside hydrolase family 32 protein [Halobacillus naozhouensis]|uniref:Sucrose-6-phosphate hydrolase n=1 Tax=Halobacillus naozhouensis TaxID=554880 RepID=A0ABY8IWE9_9BACI|nr:sucrose-6-phosphate hydrolase [Halobacillus naozhouensis]WFT74549.1 sucrose-6-phosphate hydrolase [Halobacillus naozhouensis]
MNAKDRELRNKAAATVEENEERVNQDHYRLNYHHMPPAGLLSDPNGLIQWNGVFHLFYQWMPFHTGHGEKFWGHCTSKDFVNWEQQPIALTPSSWFDKDGCYSGSAVVHDDKMYLFYTGNVVNEQGEGETYQCMAVSDDGIHFDKKGPVIHLPEGYTSDFRDPKVWEKEGSWYMVIGAQSKKRHGKAVLFRSEDLTHWELVGNITGSYEQKLGELGYMWECPDFFELEGQGVLIVSPQGLKANGMAYNNRYQSGYFTGTLDYNRGDFTHAEFKELDRGFEFYAPQTTLDEKGRRILFGWMGVPEQYEEAHPTIENRWIHCLTIPRELEWEGNQIVQKPLEELKEMRESVLLHSDITIENDQKGIRGVGGNSVEIQLEFENIEEQFALELFHYAAFSYQKKDGILTLSRPHLEDKSKTEFRRVKLDGELSQLRLFIDHSTLEVFVNGGEEVFTSRIFPQKGNDAVLFTSLGASTFSIEQWKLSGYTYS